VATGIKEQASKLLESLPEESNWDGLMRAIYERLLVEEGIADFEAGRTVTNEEVRRRFGLTA